MDAGTERSAVVAAILVGGGAVLVARRTGPGALAGRWEFPGGKVEPDETLPEALVRELREELGVTIQVDAEFESTSGPWPIDDRHVLHVFFATLVAGEPAPLGSHDEVRWVDADELLSLDLLDADRPVAAALAGSPAS